MEWRSAGCDLGLLVQALEVCEASLRQAGAHQAARSYRRLLDQFRHRQELKEGACALQPLPERSQPQPAQPPLRNPAARRRRNAPQLLPWDSLGANLPVQ